jgi:hypothetical protein
MQRLSRAPRGRRFGGAIFALALVTAVIVAVPAGARPTAAGANGKDLWKHVPGTPAATKNGHDKQVKAKKLRAYTLDRGAAAQLLATAPAESAATNGVVVSLPAPTGELQRFALEASPVLEPELAAKHPEIKTYAGTGLDDKTATIRADLTPLGFHASVRSAHGAWYIDPVYERDDSLYASYFARDLGEDPNEGFVERDDETGASEASDEVAAAAVPEGPAVQLRTYRLALLSDPSYATFFGAANVTAAKATLINRVTQIYEEETAIRLVIIAGNDALNLNTDAAMTGANGPCGAAPCFTAAQATGCTSGTLGRNRIVIGQLVGASAYDAGHIIFGLPGGGVASLNSIGGNSKAQGCTGLPAPTGDYFAVDYVAHELGHQFGGNHTFNGNQFNCSGGNRNAATSVEPGSGSSIMAYAGICRHDNLQPHSDPYWSQRSYQEITTYVTSSRPAINEVQTVSLRGFDTDGDSFTLSFGGATTAPIVRGTNYTTAAIDAALEAILPAGGTVTVAAWGGSGGLNDTGFQVTFTGTLAGANQASLGLNPTGASGFVGETAKGGPIDNQGNTVTATGNHAPVVTVPMAFTIPTRTPFALTGSATDFDGDTLSYMWEQNDRGGTATALVNNVKTTGPLFRQFGTALQEPPYVETEFNSPGGNVVGTDPTRVFPDLAQILVNNTNAATGGCTPFTDVWPTPVPFPDVDCYSEFLPTADWVGFAGDRTMTFRFTARDIRSGGGGVGNGDTRVTIAPAAGPFLVTSQATAESVAAGSSQEITWDVAGTNLPPVSTENVKISLSLDGGWTYPVVLAESTSNDGSESFVLPNVDTDHARVKIEAVGNVYFDISATDFVVRGAAQQIEELAAFVDGLGPGSSLAAKVRAAGASLERGSVGATCNQLQALQNEVDAQAGGSITAAQAAELTTRIGWIRTALGC